MVIEEKDILQINATIIAGAFIFLSLSLAIVDQFVSTRLGNETLMKSASHTAVYGNNTPPINNHSKISTANEASDNKKIRTNDVQIFGAYAIIVPFAISSILAIRELWINHHDPVKHQHEIKWSLAFMILGFFILVFVIALLMLLMFIR